VDGQEELISIELAGLGYKIRDLLFLEFALSQPSQLVSVDILGRILVQHVCLCIFPFSFSVVMLLPAWLSQGLACVI
jgi:hypothetical protein